MIGAVLWSIAEHRATMPAWRGRQPARQAANLAAERDGDAGADVAA
jgi:hypothetical protein